MPACSSGWRPWVRWRRASPTRSVTRWRPCRGRFSCCARNSQLTDEQAQLLDIVLRESARLNQTISHFLAYARPAALQRGPRRRAAGRPRHRDAAAQQRRPDEPVTSSTWTCRPIPSGARPTKARCRRSSGTWPPTACAPCRDGGRLRLAARGAPTRDRRRPRGARTRASASPKRNSTGSSSRSTARSAAGTGLGMAIVHRIVSDYGGEIRVASKPGAGTTVTVRLRLARRRDRHDDR